MRRALSTGAILMFVLALLGCGQNAQDRFSEASSDSLLASNPVEQPEGDISPQAEYPEPQEQEPEPTPAPPKRTVPKRTPPPPPRKPVPKPDPGVLLSAGTPIEVSVTGQISSETAAPGETWVGEVTENVIVDNTVVIPAGSTVNGVVTATKAAEKGSRAFLVLGVQSITVNGVSHPVGAGADSIIAGSTRARNLGAIAGGAAAGALIGKAVGGSGKGALIGGLLGGAAAGGAVAKSKGYQVVIKEGTIITFTVSENVRMRS